jgi:hypothetical protein
MKIAASDYDGTLFRSEEISKADVDGVNKWRNAGNKFGVVTGRDYGMLMPQLKHYGVKSDYVVCNNGGLICKVDGTALWQGNISAETLAAVAAENCVQNSFHFAFSAIDTTYLCHESEGSWIMREAKQWDFKITKINKKDILKLPQIHQFSLGYVTSEESLAAGEILNKKYGAIIHAYPNRCSLDITPQNVSKRQGIEKLMELMNWNDSEVFAIGDEINDLPMLKAFNGFTVDTARTEIKNQVKGVFSGVGSMLISNI